MPFSNPVVAGTTLVRSAIQSPNFVAGSTGWSINRDGTAEFHGLTITGGTIIQAGNGGMFVYTGPPAFGNLAISISPVSGTDPYGNAFPAGSTFYAAANPGRVTMNAALLLGMGFNPDPTAYADGGLSSVAVDIATTPPTHIGSTTTLQGPVLAGQNVPAVILKAGASGITSQIELQTDSVAIDNNLFLTNGTEFIVGNPVESVAGSLRETSNSAAVTNVETAVSAWSNRCVAGVMYEIQWHLTALQSNGGDVFLLTLRLDSSTGTILNQWAFSVGSTMSNLGVQKSFYMQWPAPDSNPHSIYVTLKRYSGSGSCIRAGGSNGKLVRIG